MRSLAALCALLSLLHLAAARATGQHVGPYEQILHHLSELLKDCNSVLCSSFVPMIGATKNIDEISCRARKSLNKVHSDSSHIKALVHGLKLIEKEAEKMGKSIQCELQDSEQDLRALLSALHSHFQKVNYNRSSI